MKRMLLILTLCSALTSPAQTLIGTTYFLNGDSIDINTCYVNPLSIERIDVDEKAKAVYLKAKKDLGFLTLNDVLRIYTDVAEGKPVIFMIDGKIVTDKVPIRIDGSYFIYVKAKPFDEIKYIGPSIKDVVLVEITLSTKKLGPKITIRGEELVAKN